LDTKKQDRPGDKRTPEKWKEWVCAPSQPRKPLWKVRKRKEKGEGDIRPGREEEIVEKTFGPKEFGPVRR